MRLYNVTVRIFRGRNTLWFKHTLNFTHKCCLGANWNILTTVRCDKEQLDFGVKWGNFGELHFKRAKENTDKLVSLDSNLCVSCCSAVTVKQFTRRSDSKSRWGSGVEWWVRLSLAFCVSPNLTS